MCRRADRRPGGDGRAKTGDRPGNVAHSRLARDRSANVGSTRSRPRRAHRGVTRSARRRTFTGTGYPAAVERCEPASATGRRGRSLAARTGRLNHDGTTSTTFLQGTRVVAVALGFGIWDL